MTTTTIDGCEVHFDGPIFLDEKEAFSRRALAFLAEA